MLGAAARKNSRTHLHPGERGTGKYYSKSGDQGGRWLSSPRHAEGQPNGAVPVLGLPTQPFPYLGSPSPHFQGGSLSNPQPQVPNRNAQQAPPLASHLARHWKGRAGPGLSLRGGTTVTGQAQRAGRYLRRVSASPWDRHSAASRPGHGDEEEAWPRTSLTSALVQSEDCCQEGSPSVSLGSRAEASPPGGHCPACGSEAAEDTGLTLRLPGSVQDPDPTPALSTSFPKPPPHRRQHQQGREGGSHTKLCYLTQKGDLKPGAPRAGPWTT